MYIERVDANNFQRKTEVNKESFKFEAAPLDSISIDNWIKDAK